MRKARQEQAAAAAEAQAAGLARTETVEQSSSRYHFLPKRSATLGSSSVKDSTGGEVIGDRVILYIHGESETKVTTSGNSESIGL